MAAAIFSFPGGGRFRLIPLPVHLLNAIDDNDPGMWLAAGA